MKEMDVLPIYVSRELVVFVEPGLPGTPVVASSPVLHQPAHLGEGDAVVQARSWQLIGPSGTSEPLAQVVQLGLRNLDAARSDLLADVGHEWISLSRVVRCAFRSASRGCPVGVSGDVANERQF